MPLFLKNQRVKAKKRRHGFCRIIISAYQNGMNYVAFSFLVSKITIVVMFNVLTLVLQYAEVNFQQFNSFSGLFLSLEIKYYD
jgi:hypothetical protein